MTVRGVAPRACAVTGRRSLALRRLPRAWQHTSANFCNLPRFWLKFGGVWHLVAGNIVASQDAFMNMWPVSTTSCVDFDLSPAEFTQKQACSAKFWPTPTRVSPKFADLGQIPADVGQLWLIFAAFRPNFSNFCRARPTPARIRAKFRNIYHRRGPKLAKS